MHPQLEQIRSEQRAVGERFARLNGATPDDVWTRRADPDSWSVAECIAHLNLTAAAMVPLLRGAWAEAKALGAGAPPRFKRTTMGALVAAMVGPVPGWGRLRLGKVRTPPSFVPSGELRRAAVVAEFERWQREERALVEEADALPVDRVRLESPFVKGTRYDGYSSLWILVRHEHRHLAQAERALDASRKGPLTR